MTEHQQESQLITRTNNDLSNEPLGATFDIAAHSFWIQFWLASKLEPISSLLAACTALDARGNSLGAFAAGGVADTVLCAVR